MPGSAPIRSDDLLGRRLATGMVAQPDLNSRYSNQRLKGIVIEVSVDVAGSFVGAQETG